MPLKLPTEALAQAIAEEWAGQGDHIKPATMALTQLSNTAIDRVAGNPAPAIQELLAYAGADLLCYRAGEPAALVERQQKLWQPLLDWLALRHDAPLAVHAGVIHKPQPEPSIAALRRHLGSLSPFELTGLAAITPLAGSLVIALALHEGRISADEAFDLAELDASFQIERWGEDEEAAFSRQGLRQQLHDIRRFLQLSGA